MPTCPGVSRRDPALTYAAIETDLAAGSRAVITRGPSGSTVRSNIEERVPEGTSRLGNQAAGAEGAGRCCGSSGGRAYLGR